MNKKTLAIIGLLLCLAGAVILLLDKNNSEHLPKILKGKGLWLLILGSSISFIYSLIQKNKSK